MNYNILGAAVIALGSMAGASQAATIDLGFAIDESGSVSGSAASGELGLLREGLARALDRIPSVGAPGNPNTYTVTVVRFASSASVLVAKTAITDATRSDIQNTLRTAARISGGTNIAAAVSALTGAVCGIGTDTCTADTTLFNIATDGSGTSPVPSANPQAILAGVDGISYEAIGGGASPATIATFAFPTPVVVINDAADLPNPINNGFVFAVNAFEDFEDAIGAKVGRIVIDTGGGGDTNVVPLPAAGWMLLSGLGAIVGLRRRRAA